MDVETIARVCHEVNAAYCRSQGDMSQPLWDEAPQWQKESAVNGVVFHLNTPNVPESASHEKWMADKEKAGWKHGPVKDPELKEHPSFLPYAELPASEKAKDFLFKQVVASLRSL